MSAYRIILVAASITTAFIFAFILARLVLGILSKSKQKASLKKAIGANNEVLTKNLSCTGLAKTVLGFCISLSNTLHFAPSSMRMTAKFVKSKKLPDKIEKLKTKSNITEDFNNFSYREAQCRLALILGSIGLVIGFVISTTLGLLLCAGGVMFGVVAPSWALRQESLARTELLEKNLPEMLEVITLGLRSGLTFDRSFSIYISHFDTEFSHMCKIAIDKWQNGISTRADSLRALSASYDSYLFERTIDVVIRALRFGTSAVENLEEAAADARAAYKTKQEEAVAKAPVKMMIPTGVLILPAMLLLVLGPVLLELSGGF